jgi:hypothetical protein
VDVVEAVEPDDVDVPVEPVVPATPAVSVVVVESSAYATPGVLATAKPTPNDTANTPTRPT